VQFSQTISDSKTSVVGERWRKTSEAMEDI